MHITISWLRHRASGSLPKLAPTTRDCEETTRSCIQRCSHPPVLACSAGIGSAKEEDNNGATDMDKTKPDQTLSGRPIAKRVVAKMKLPWQRKVVNIKNVIAGHAMAEELQKTVVSQKELEGFHRAHAAYVYAQNQVSIMSEQLTALKEMAPFVDIISKAEDLYVPSAPPMSPLTTSYFTCWAFFDACAGPANETIGTVVLEVGATFRSEEHTSE